MEKIRFDKYLCKLLVQEEFSEIKEEYGFEQKDFEILDSEFNYQDGWLNYYIQYFKYKGIKYSFEYWKHASPNCCDSEIISEYAVKVSE